MFETNVVLTETTADILIIAQQTSLCVMCLQTEQVIWAFCVAVPHLQFGVSAVHVLCVELALLVIGRGLGVGKVGPNPDW